MEKKVNDFKQSLADARDGAGTLPGGELLIEEQEEIIGMLEGLKRRKQ